jgi:hypothetical protein
LYSENLTNIDLLKSGEHTIETIALIEVAGSHDECLLTQMHAITNSGNRVVLVCTQEIRERNPHFEPYVDAFFIVTFNGSNFKRLGEMRRTLKFMEKKGVTRAVLNTAQGDLMRNLCIIALFSSIEFTGIIHTTRKLKGSFTQRMISKKVKKYLLLSEYLLSTVKAPKGVSLDYFYPIRFVTSTEVIEKRTKVVTVIGGVENRRKDLNGFLQMIEQIQEENIRFFFLGKSDPSNEDVQHFQEKIKELGLTTKIVTFDDFVPQKEFSTYLNNTDLILPLIHPDTPSADQYFKNQISGAMSVSFGLKIPMLIHEAYQNIEEMNGASFYYSVDSFSEVLSSSLQTVDSKKTAMKNDERYNVDFQEERYLKFLFS